MARKKKTASNARGCGVAFGLLFVAVSVVACYFLSYVPISHWLQAQSWTPTPCTITQSTVGSHRSKNSDTYSIDITYQYEVAGVSHTGNDYNFFHGSSSGYDDKQAVVDQYPAGTQATCYVDPADPDKAVLSRDWSWGYAIGLIFLGAFGLIGTAVAIGSSRKSKPIVPVPLGAPSSDSSLTPDSTGAQVLESAISPKKTLLSSTIFTIVWYAILGVVGWAFLHEGIGWANAIPAAIVSVMSLAGLLGVAGIVRGFLGLWNPRVRVTLEPGALRLGGTVSLAWQVEGDTSRLSTLKIYVQGKEYATYRRGTDTTTDTSIFDKITIVEASTRTDLQSGRVDFAMPEFTMHTLVLPNNKIEWTIRVEGEIPKWPDVEEEFPVIVLPLLNPGAAPHAAELAP